MIFELPKSQKYMEVYTSIFIHSRGFAHNRFAVLLLFGERVKFHERFHLTKSYQNHWIFPFAGGSVKPCQASSRKDTKPRRWWITITASLILPHGWKKAGKFWAWPLDSSPLRYLCCTYFIWSAKRAIFSTTSNIKHRNPGLPTLMGAHKRRLTWLKALQNII